MPTKPMLTKVMLIQQVKDVLEDKTGRTAKISKSDRKDIIPDILKAAFTESGKKTNLISEFVHGKADTTVNKLITSLSDLRKSLSLLSGFRKRTLCKLICATIYSPSDQDKQALINFWLDDCLENASTDHHPNLDALDALMTAVIDAHLMSNKKDRETITWTVSETVSLWARHCHQDGNARIRSTLQPAMKRYFSNYAACRVNGETPNLASLWANDHKNKGLSDLLWRPDRIKMCAYQLITQTNIHYQGHKAVNLIDLSCQENTLGQEAQQ